MSKTPHKAALSALMISALMVSTTVASAETGADNVNRISAGAESTSSYGGTDTKPASSSALLITGGTLFVDQDYNTNANGTDKAVNLGGPGTNTNAWLKGGRVVVGQHADGKAASGVTLSVDNMTIDGGLMVVTSNAALNSGGGININAGGTLEVSQGEQNVIQTSTANLRGGTLAVTKGAQLTITSPGGTFGPLQPEASDANGSVLVTRNATFNAYGGTINAALVVGTDDTGSGKVVFKSGTTTVDKLTMQGTKASSTIEGNATVNALTEVNIDGHGSGMPTLEMKGGTQRVLNSTGALNVRGGGNLLSSIGVNTVDANVNLSTGGSASTSGTIKVSGSSSLTITKNLHIETPSSVSVAGTNAALTVNGGLKALPDSIQVGGKAEDGRTGILTLGYGALTAKAADKTSNLVADGAITLGSGANGGTLPMNNTGTLIIKNYAGSTFDVNNAAAVQGITEKTDGGVLVGDYEKNNVVLWGTHLVADGKTVETKTTGDKRYVAGVHTVIAPASTGATPAITTKSGVMASSVSTVSGNLDITTGGSLSLIGMGRDDASNETTTLNTLTLGKNGEAVGGLVTVNNGAGLHVGTLDMTGMTDMPDMSKGGLDVINTTASIGTLKAGGGTLFVDPAIVTIGGIQDNDLKNMSLLTSAGSIVTLGGAQGWMVKPMADAGFTFSDSSKATLGIAPTGTIKIGAAGVVAVEPSIVKDGNDYEFTKPGNTTTTVVSQNAMGAFWAGNNTLTVLDVSALGDKPVFDLTDTRINTVNILDGAKLHVANLTVKGAQIFSSSQDGGFKVGVGKENTLYDPAAANAGWMGNNLTQPDRMLSASMNKTDFGKIDVSVNSASAVFGMSSEFEGLMQGVWGNALNNVNAENAGIRLVSRAASTDYGMSAAQVSQTIEGAAQLGVVAGVQGVTISAANAATSAVSNRTSFAQPLLDKSKAVALNRDDDGRVNVDSALSGGNSMKKGLALWMMPLYQSDNMRGQNVGNFSTGYSSDLGGVVAGVDYTVNDMLRFGAALNMGAGKSRSKGDFSRADNNFDFWGVNLYAGWTMNNFGLTADVGYTGNTNEVEQDIPASLGMSNLKSDIDSSAWAAGLKAEYKIETSVMDIIPHVGVRYMGLTTDQYNVKSGDHTIFDVEKNRQSIWTFPIGVTMSKDIAMGSDRSGWTFRPRVDLAVIPAAGDLDAKSNSRIPGAPGFANVNMPVVDSVTFDGGIGFDIGSDNLSFGLNYNIQTSEHRTGHGFFGTVRYAF